MAATGNSAFIGKICWLGAVVLLSLPLTPGSSVAQWRFDHFTTGFRLEGAHRLAECESCHTDGMFAGTPTDCVGCHSQASRTNATSRPQTHITTTDRCDACHRPTAWVGITRVDHLETLGSCNNCHNGRKADGKPPMHLPTSDQCEDCHRTTSWLPAAFEHSGIVGGCFSCHDGMTATGKPVTHIPATNLCEDCHNAFSWSPVSRVDHLQVLGVCSSCHNGVIATGQHPQHIVTSEECDSCHNTLAWQ